MMHFLPESVFRVCGAIVLGAALIVGALWIQNRTSAEAVGGLPAVVVARRDVRTIVPAPDSDNDGLPDWEEALHGTDPRTKTVFASTTPALAEKEPYTPPQTLTGRFAERFFEDIVRAGAGDGISLEEQTALVSKAVSMLARETQDRLYTQADIKSTAENHVETLRAYGNALGAIMLAAEVPNENVLVIFERAMTKNDPAALDALAPIERGYAKIIRDTLALRVPREAARTQVDLLNALSMVHADIVAMQKAFEDPLAALVRAKRYRDDALGVFYTIEHIRSILESRSIAYTSDESGIFLFSLRP